MFIVKAAEWSCAAEELGNATGIWLFCEISLVIFSNRTSISQGAEASPCSLKGTLGSSWDHKPLEERKK